MLRETVYISPDTRSPLRPSTSGDALESSENERFEFRDGIAYLLPAKLENDLVKQREKEGWRVVFEKHHWEPTAATILSFPGDSTDPYWIKVRECLPMVDRVLGNVSGKLGLDLACGMGWASSYFTRKGARMIAADFNDTRHNGLGAAILVREHGIEFDAVCCDGESLPIADGSLDFAFICSALHHFTRPLVTLKEIYRVLKPGGLLIDICESYRTGTDDDERDSTYEPLVEFREAGINEASFLEREYEAFFVTAGFGYSVYMPGWDAPAGEAPGKAWENVDAAKYSPGRAAWKHAIVQLVAGTPLVRVLRRRKLHRTVSNRVIIANKPH